MNKNVGTIDKALRIGVAAIMAYLYFSETVTGTLGIVALVISIAALATSAIGFCGLYSILGISTCKVAKAMNQWDERFSGEEYVYGTKPNAFLEEQLPLLEPGSILFACEGEGRNAVFAASLGWNVSAFDGSIEGKKKALKLAAEKVVTIDYRIGDATDIEYPAESFDCIVFIYAHFPASIRAGIHQRALGWLKPGGTVIMEAFNPEQLPRTSGGPKDITMLYTPEMLMQDFEEVEDISISLESVTLDEGPLHQGKAEVIRMIAKK